MGGRFGRHVSYANVATTLALVLAMTGGAIAATGGFDSGGTLRGCVNPKGMLRLLKAGKHCAKGQQQISWSEQGPAGPKGATGAEGRTGAQGSEGPKGIDGKSPAGSTDDVKWGLVSRFGTLEAGDGAVAAAEGPVHYTIAFDGDVTGCGIVATPNGPANTTRAIISAVPAGTEVDVYIYTPDGEHEDIEGFTVTAYCPAPS